MKKLLVVAAIALAVGIGVTACTPEEVSTTAIAQAFPEQSLQQTAIAIAKCESNLQADAYNPNGGYTGLFQISPIHQSLIQSMGYSWSDMTNPFANAKVARALYNQSGWSPWHGTCGGSLGI